MLLLLFSLTPLVAGDSYNKVTTSIADACDCTDLPTDPVELRNANFDMKVRVLQSRMNLGTHVVIGPVGDPPAESGLNAQDPIYMALQQELPDGTFFTIEPSCCRTEKTCVDFTCPDGYFLTSTAGCNAEECERDQCCTKEAQCADFDCGDGHVRTSDGGCNATVCTYDKCCEAEPEGPVPCTGGELQVITTGKGCKKWATAIVDLSMEPAACYDTCQTPEMHKKCEEFGGTCGEYFSVGVEWTPGVGQKACDCHPHNLDCGLEENWADWFDEAKLYRCKQTAT